MMHMRVMQENFITQILSQKNKEDTDNRMLFEEINYSYKSVSLSKSNLISIYQYTKKQNKSSKLFPHMLYKSRR